MRGMKRLAADAKAGPAKTSPAGVPCTTAWRMVHLLPGYFLAHVLAFASCRSDQHSLCLCCTPPVLHPCSLLHPESANLLPLALYHSFHISGQQAVGFDKNICADNVSRAKLQAPAALMIPSWLLLMTVHTTRVAPM